MVRAPACHAGGRGFEPRLSRHRLRPMRKMRAFSSGWSVLLIFQQKFNERGRLGSASAAVVDLIALSSHSGMADQRATELFEFRARCRHRAIDVEAAARIFNDDDAKSSRARIFG